jgi:hypothetical protein
MTIILYVFIFSSGVLVGYLGRVWITHKFTDYSGTIIVDTDDLRETTVYSLVLEDYPEKLEFKKEVVFRVDTSGKSSNRK